MFRYEDMEFVPGRMNNEEYQAGKFAQSLRLRLFREFLDVDEGLSLKNRFMSLD